MPTQIINTDQGTTERRFTNQAFDVYDCTGAVFYVNKPEPLAALASLTAERDAALAQLAVCDADLATAWAAVAAVTAERDAALAKIAAGMAALS